MRNITPLYLGRYLNIAEKESFPGVEPHRLPSWHDIEGNELESCPFVVFAFSLHVFLLVNYRNRYTDANHVTFLMNRTVRFGFSATFQVILTFLLATWSRLISSGVALAFPPLTWNRIIDRLSGSCLLLLMATKSTIPLYSWPFLDSNERQL